MNYVAKARFLFRAPNGRKGYAVQTVNVDKKSDIYVILALKKLFGAADYEILDVEWRQIGKNSI